MTWILRLFFGEKCRLHGRYRTLVCRSCAEARARFIEGGA